MTSPFLRISLVVALMAHPANTLAQRANTSWLDEAKPAGWNTPGGSIPAAPTVQGPADAKCSAQARPPQLEEDARVREQGWALIGAFQGGWQTVVIRATAGYDGMCRPRQYQDFVFVKGAFAGTLSPQPMDSRTDGSLTRVALQGPNRLTAEYVRYAEKDALCCPSRTTTVVFEIPAAAPVRPISSSTASQSSVFSSSPASTLARTSWLPPA
jgi:hypothetical protein